MSETEKDERLSLNEAIEMLTVAEVRTIERHYGRTLDSKQIGGVDLTVAVIWALERRKFSGKDRPDWPVYDGWTMGQLNGYFRTDELEVDPNEPETDQGKDD